MDVAKLIKKTNIIIWDEALMVSKHCFETLDMSMHDVLKFDKPFGGEVIVFGWNFRKNLPVITECGRVVIV